MDCTDRPILGLNTDVNIEKAQNEVDAHFRQQLARKQEATPEAIEAFRRQFPTHIPKRLMDKTPKELLLTLVRYVLCLFDAEAKSYPNDACLEYWLEMLASRVFVRAITTVENLEAEGRDIVSLAHHGVTQKQMVEVIHEALDKNIKARLSPPTAKKVTQAPPPPTEVGGGGGFQPTPKAIESPSAPKETPEKPKRLRATVHCPSAARKMEKYISQKGISQTDFAGHAQTTDRTLRTFRSTGKVRRDIFANIAKAMGTTKDDLLKD